MAGGEVGRHVLSGVARNRIALDEATGQGRILRAGAPRDRHQQGEVPQCRSGVRRRRSHGSSNMYRKPMVSSKRTRNPSDDDPVVMTRSIPGTRRAFRAANGGGRGDADVRLAASYRLLITP